jgi:hypothetical protein
MVNGIVAKRVVDSELRSGSVHRRSSRLTCTWLIAERRRDPGVAELEQFKITLKIPARRLISVIDAECAPPQPQGLSPMTARLLNQPENVQPGRAVKPWLSTFHEVLLGFLQPPTAERFPRPRQSKSGSVAGHARLS